VPYLSADGGSFEVNQSDFLAVSLSGDDVDWELGVPTNALDQTASGTNVWKTKLDVDVVRPTAVTASALISPYFDLSDDTQNHSLSFSFSMESAFTDDTGIFTTGPYGFHVQYSTDDSQTWQLLGDINDQRGNNWYNVKETSGNVFPNESNAGWIKHTFEVNGTDTTFVTEEVSYNISDLTGNSKVNFRVVFYVSPNFIDAGYTADGVLIDDFEIKKSSPTAEFASLNAGVLFPGAEVEFEYLSTGASSYLWDFGDGGTSDVANPKHIYSAGGSFDVTLTITSPDGNASLTKENLIGVISQKSVPYSTTDGGDLEGANQDFIILNVSGTGFELGSSAVAGKSGTASGSNALVTGADDDQYANRSEAYIYMPQFDFSILGSYELNFAANYSFEEGWDGFNVEYSLDNGTTWVILNATPEEGWYDQVAVENSDGFWNELPIFTGTTNDVFETKTTDVSFLASEGFVSFRVKFLSDAAATDVGMVIDDFQMIGPAGGEAVVDFSFEGNTDCSGHSVVFTNNSTGTIQALDWDFGTGATPATAEGIGPHTVIFESSTAITSKITLTATSSISGTVVSEQSIDTSPNFDAEPFTITSVEGETVLVAPEGDLFQWFVNGGIIDGATSQNLTVTQFGSNYSVEVFRGGCSAVSSEQSVVSGIDAKLEEFGVAVFPNPAKSSVNISIGRQIKSYLTIKMFNYSGKQIFIYTVNESMDSYQKAIDLSDQKAGLYHIELVIDGERLSTKILVE
jgi:PKD repeat protein